MKKVNNSFWNYYLRNMVRERKLTPLERLSSRIGYMGAGLLIAGQWTLNPWLFIIGFLFVMIQTIVRRQWNLVVLQLNGLIAWTIHLINSLQMKKNQKFLQIKELSSMIVDLKKNKSIDSKKTIQKLQQQIDELTND